MNKGKDNASPDRYRYNDKWSNPSDRFDLYYVDPELAARVSALVCDFDLHIVSTSTWRCGKTVDDFRDLSSKNSKSPKYRSVIGEIAKLDKACGINAK